MRFASFAFAALAACATLPPPDTPYFEATTSGDNLYAASTVRVFANDQRIVTFAPHPQNNNRGTRSVSRVPGAFQAGLAATAELPAATDQDASDSPIGPDTCCHVFVDRQFTYFDGNRRIGISEAVWRQVEAVPPFVDLPISPN